MALDFCDGVLLIDGISVCFQLPSPGWSQMPTQAAEAKPSGSAYQPSCSTAEYFGANQKHANLISRSTRFVPRIYHPIFSP